MSRTTRRVLLLLLTAVLFACPRQGRAEEAESHPAGTLRGVVLDAEGAPASKAHVRLYGFGTPGASGTVPDPVRSSFDPEGLVRPPRTTTTDAQGRWSFERLVPGRQYEVEVVGAKGETAPGTSGIALAGAGPPVLNRLASSRLLRGRLVDFDGEGIRGFVSVSLARDARVWGTSQGHAQQTLARRIPTGADGRFEFRAPPGARLRLGVHVPGVASRDQGRVTVPRGADGEGSEQVIVIPVRERGGSAVEGAVRDEQGSPIAGAHVAVHTGPAHYRGWTGHGAGYAIADAEGRYRVEHLRGAFLQQMSVSAPGFASARHPRISRWHRASVPLHPRRPFTADIVLCRARTIRGRVLDASGEPIPNASVAYVREDDAVSGTGRWRAWTDAEGRYELRDVPTNKGRLYAHAHGYGQPFDKDRGRPTTVVEAGSAGGTEGMDVVLTRGRALVGFVRHPSGEPVAGVLLSVYFSRGPGVVYGHGTLYAVTGPDGRFLVEGVPGNAHVSIRAEAPTVVPTRVQVAGGGASSEAPLTITIDRAARVTGRVVDAKNRPLMGLPVQCGGYSLHALSDAEGRFVLDGVPPGRQTLTCGAAYAPVAQRVLDVSPGTPIHGVELRHAGTEVLAGRVVDPEGEPVPWATVSVNGRPPNHGIQTVSADGEGRFHVTHLPEGRYTVSSGAPQRRPALVRAGEKDVRIVARIESTTLLEGLVLDAEGKPLANADVQVALPGDSPNLSRGSADLYGGRFRLAVPASAARVTLRVLRPADHRGRPLNLREKTLERVRVADGPVTIRLEVARTISGRVVDGAGRAVPHVWVDALGTDRPAYWRGPRFRALSDAQGRFVLKGLSEKDYRLTTVAVGPWAPAAPVTVTAGAKDVDLHVLPYERVTGRVVDADGEPVSGVRVWVHRHVAADGARAASRRTRHQPLHRSTETDVAGRFALEKLPPGRLFDIRMTLPASLKETHFPVQLDGHDPTGEPVVLKLRRGLVISGRVTGADGEPVAKVRVLTRGPAGPGGRRSDELARQAYTGEDGRYAIGPFPEGTQIDMSFVVEKAHWAQGLPWLSQDRKGVVAGTEEHDIVLKRGATVSGRVEGAEAEALKGLSLELRWDKYRRTYRFDGTTLTFRFTGLVPRTYALTWSRASRRRMAFHPHPRVTAPATDIVLRRRVRHRLHGRLVGVDPHGFTASFHPDRAPRSRRPRPVAVKADGTFDLGTLDNEPGVLVITHPEQRHVVYQALTPSKAPVTAEAVKTLAIRGRVLDLPDKIHRGRIWASRGPVKFHGSMAEDGWFEIRGLPPGEWQVGLSASKPTGGTFEVKNPVRAGEHSLFVWWRPKR